MKRSTSKLLHHTTCTLCHYKRWAFIPYNGEHYNFVFVTIVDERIVVVGKSAPSKCAVRTNSRSTYTHRDNIHIYLVRLFVRSLTEYTAFTANGQMLMIIPYFQRATTQNSPQHLSSSPVAPRVSLYKRRGIHTSFIPYFINTTSKYILRVCMKKIFTRG